MSDCCCPPGLTTANAGAVAEIEDAAFLVRGQPDPPTGAVNNAVAVFSGATVQIGTTPIAITRVDDVNAGSSFKFNEAGIYEAIWWAFLPNGGAVGLMVGGSIDCGAPLLTVAQNPDLFFPEIWGSDVRFNWPAAVGVQSRTAVGTFAITPAMASNPALGVLRCHMTDSAGGVVGPFGTVIADNTLRVRRLR